jgi:RimJ/RimL family protein N-acetyltransferase
MKGFGLELKPLSESTLEQVRQWRNDEQTSRYMEFRNEISVEDQQKWFSSILNAYYYVIYSDSIPVGLIDLKKIDLNKKTAESGLLIGNKEFIGTGIALGASILLLNFAFDQLKLEVVTAKIGKENYEAEKYNQLLGFELSQSMNDDFRMWELRKEVYHRKKITLISFLEK